MPLVFAVWMRSPHMAAPFGGWRLVVSARIMLRNMPGYLSAKVWPIMPPIDSPIQWLRVMPSVANRPCTSSAIWSRVYSPSGAADRP